MIDPGLRTKDTEPEARDMGASRGGGIGVVVFYIRLIFKQSGDSAVGLAALFCDRCGFFSCARPMELFL